MENLYLRGFERYEEIYSTLAGDKKSLVFGISDPQKAHLAAASPVPLLYIADGEARALEVAEEIASYGTPSAYLPPKGDVLLGKRTDARSYARISALFKVLNGEARVLVTTVEAVFGYLPRPEDLRERSLTLSVGRSISAETLASDLVRAGYERVMAQPKKGEFRLAGDSLSIFPINADTPSKVDLLYDEVESIKTYAPDFLGVIDRPNELFVAPASELLLSEEDVKEAFRRIEAARKLQNRSAKLRTDEILSDLSLRAAGHPSDGGLTYLIPFVRERLCTVFDFLDGFSAFVDEPKKIFEGFSRFLIDHFGRVQRLAEDGEVLAAHRGSIASEREIMTALSAMPQLGVSSFTERISGRSGAFYLNSASLPNYIKNTNMFVGFVEDELREGRRVLVFTQDEERRVALERLLGGNAAAVEYVAAKLRHGFVSKSERTTFVGSGDILSPVSALHLPKRPLIAPKIGDYVVHDEFGVGRCLGLTHIKNYAGEGDYLAIQYAGQNKIYLPVAQMDMVTLYSGSETEPELSDPNKEEFQKEKAKARKSIRKMALDLVDLYAKREQSKGFVYPEGGESMRAFEERFPYEETEGQLAAIDDIRADMEKGKVMDRLLCGDVGYGKTEVALRAAFRTVLAGKQVAFLAPTTILAEQHYRTASERFAPFGVKCACLTRFCTAKEVKEILKGVRNGSIEVLVGTHRLLGKDVEFADVGLLILDEEQRFGVEHKEKIKALRTSINVLSMSATPIPRTLHMALSGIRDISVIDTPPKNRKPVRTVVAEYSAAMLKEAVGAELARGGQVFILYNNIAKLEHYAAAVKEMFPSALVVSGHGRMGANELEENIRKFYLRQADILICTTIIENGIDIPDANTLVVLEADKLGLSQMYQLKGRVGRSSRLAYAYFTYPSGTLLTGDAEKRLRALAENGDLGSGYRLAMMDLEIRGAGNVLGAEQHGHIEKVGYEMYCTLLREAIAELNGEAMPETGGVEMVVKADAYLPTEYIPSELARIRYYKKIAAITDEKAKGALLDEMEAEYGIPPLKAHTLVQIALLKGLASALPVKRISLDAKEVSVTYRDDELPASAAMRNALALLSGELREGDRAGNEVRYLLKAGSVTARIGVMIRFVKALRGEAI
ncbi:MAG: transcription-repair coupling factor [Clostridia bacterium]|nr:transcription-repair coupling factor [Clostridia bacterium]